MNVILFGWNRSIPGREQLSGQHFDDFVQYLQGLQQGGSITSFDVVFLNSHRGDLNGFFIIRGEPAQLGALVSSLEWEKHMTRASLHLEQSGAVGGVTGEAVAERMKIWQSLLPA